MEGFRATHLNHEAGYKEEFTKTKTQFGAKRFVCLIISPLSSPLEAHSLPPLTEREVYRGHAVQGHRVSLCHSKVPACYHRAVHSEMTQSRSHTNEGSLCPHGPHWKPPYKELRLKQMNKWNSLTSWTPPPSLHPNLMSGSKRLAQCKARRETLTTG